MQVQRKHSRRGITQRRRRLARKFRILLPERDCGSFMGTPPPERREKRTLSSALSHLGVTRAH